MGKLQTILKWRAVRALQVWDHLPIRAQGGITVFIPVVAILVSFIFAIYGNLSRADREDDIQRKFQAVRQYSGLLTLMIDAETGERGFLLTQRAEYLEPYKKAMEEIPGTITQLKELVQAEPGENPRLERIDALSKIQEQIDRQLAQLKDSQNFTHDRVNVQALNEHLQRGKSQMDEIRASISAMQNKEEVLLSSRIEEINSIRFRDYLFVFITLLVALIVRIISFYLFDRGIVRRIGRLNAYVRSTLNGEESTYVASKKTDAIGVLESSVVELSGQYDDSKRKK
jgi:CHASE3 domain sensor protein